MIKLKASGIPETIDKYQLALDCAFEAGRQVGVHYGHTREQIGLAQDDRREGLGAHHVYCRAVTGDNE